MRLSSRHILETKLGNDEPLTTTWLLAEVETSSQSQNLLGCSAVIRKVGK